MNDWETTRTSTKKDGDAANHHNNILIAVLIFQVLLILAVGAILGMTVYILIGVSNMERRQLLNDLAIAQLLKWLTPHGG
jgi:hypothetical protein